MGSVGAPHGTWKHGCEVCDVHEAGGVNVPVQSVPVSWAHTENASGVGWDQLMDRVA